MGTKTEYITGTIVSILGTAFTYAIGGFDKLLIALTIFMVIDYLTGVMASFVGSNLSSKIGFKGIRFKRDCYYFKQFRCRSIC